MDIDATLTLILLLPLLLLILGACIVAIVALIKAKKRMYLPLRGLLLTFTAPG